MDRQTLPEGQKGAVLCAYLQHSMARAKSVMEQPPHLPGMPPLDSVHGDWGQALENLRSYLWGRTWAVDNPSGSSLDSIDRTQWQQVSLLLLQSMQLAVDMLRRGLSSDLRQMCCSCWHIAAGLLHSQPRELVSGPFAMAQIKAAMAGLHLSMMAGMTDFDRTNIMDWSRCLMYAVCVQQGRFTLGGHLCPCV